MSKMGRKADIGFKYIIALLLAILTLLFILGLYGALGSPAKELLGSAFNFHFMW